MLQTALLGNYEFGAVIMKIITAGRTRRGFDGGNTAQNLRDYSGGGTNPDTVFTSCHQERPGVVVERVTLVSRSQVRSPTTTNSLYSNEIIGRSRGSRSSSSYKCNLYDCEARRHVPPPTPIRSNLYQTI